MDPSASMTDRICVVTGVTSGIGFITARELARLGATVVAVGRDPRRTDVAVQRIVTTTGNSRVRAFVADLSIRSDVRRLAAEIRVTFPRVHVLVNNAGAVFTRRSTTSEGFERTWALNVVAPFLLSHLLLPALTQSAPARIINVASAAHRGARLNFDDLQAERRYSGFGVYSRSKLALVLLTYEFARRLTGTGVTVNALHPGFVASQFGLNNPGAFRIGIRLASFLFGISSDRGARTSVYLASDRSVEGVTGKYFARRRSVASSPASYDVESGQRLWDVLSLQTGIPSDVLSEVGHSQPDLPQTA